MYDLDQMVQTMIDQACDASDTDDDNDGLDDLVDS